MQLKTTHEAEAMSLTTHPLSRAQTQTAFARLLPKLSEGPRRLAEHLLQLIGPEGDATIAKLHTELFPVATTKSASAQLTTLLGNIQSAAKASGLTLAHEYLGSKQAGTANRKLRFLGPPPMLRAETETLDAIAPAQRIEGQRADLLFPEHLVILVTFNEHEFTAVRSAFWSAQNAPDASSRPLTDRPPISADDLGLHGNIRVLHHHSRQGNRESQRATSDLQAAFQPRAVVAVGIAFGAEEDKQQLGDVLVSEFIVDYERGKVHKDGSLSLRGARPEASYAWLRALEQLNTRYNNDHHAKTTWPRLHFGGLLSGEKLVDQLDYRNSLKKLAEQDDIVGGEMEAVGLHTALKGTRTDWLVIKAICDWADGNKGQDKARRQQDAAEHAAQVVKMLIDSRTLYADESASDGSPSQGLRQRSRPKDARHLMSRAQLSEIDPRAILSAGQTATAVHLDTLNEDAHKGQNIQKEAPGIVAFDDILQWVEATDGPPLYALLGEYGMGKTTTSQRVFEHIRTRFSEGQTTRPAVYFDLRKVERLVAASDTSPGQVPQLKEAIEDCLRHGYLSDGPEPPNHADVLHAIDQGAVVIFDGLDEVLSRLQDKQGLTFTANLLRVLPDARTRRRPDATAPAPKVLLSCRTQFFRSLTEQHNHLTGEHRGAQPASQYRAVVLRPFTDDQIRDYLKAALPGADIEVLMQRIASVHNLTDLSKRPFTLKLVARFLPQIERWQAEGRAITGATLYRQVAREWLIRDKEKQRFQPEDKEQLAAALAAHLWQTRQRGLSAKALETWLGVWLSQQPPGADCLGHPRNLLQQDLRNATFLRRIDDGQESRFEFSHSSLQEFFLAEHLARKVLHGAEMSGDAARLNRLFEAWAGPTLSDETLDFLCQILSEHRDDPRATQVLNLWRKTYRPQASELLLRYAMAASEDAPRPLLAGFNLEGAQLQGMRLERTGNNVGAPLLAMQSIKLSGADLRRTQFHGVRLDDADLSGARLDQAAFVDCSLQRVNLQGTQLIGTTLRGCALNGTDLSTAGPVYRAQVSACRGLAMLPQSAEAAAWLIPPVKSPHGSIATTSLQWLPGHNGTVNSVAYCPDGSRIAAASADSTLRILDARTGEQILALQGHSDGVNSVAYSHDGARIVTASEDCTLRVWDALSGNHLLTLKGHLDSANSAVFSPDGSKIASTARDNTVRIWDSQTGKHLFVLEGHKDWGWVVAFSPDGLCIASAGEDRVLRLWDLSTRKPTLALQGHLGTINAVAFSPNGSCIVTVSTEGSLRIWDTQTGEILNSFQDIQDAERAVVYSPDGAYIASAASNGKVRFLDAHSGEQLGSLDAVEPVRSLAYSPDGRSIATSGFSGVIAVWDMLSGRPNTILQYHSGFVASLAFFPDGERIASTTTGNALCVWNMRSDAPPLNITRHHLAPIYSVACSPVGSCIASGSLDQTVRLWDADSGEPLHTLRGHDGSVSSVAFSPDGLRIASASNDRTIRIWDTSSGNPLLILKGHQNWINSIAFSPDGSRVASAAVDGAVLLWDIQSGAFLHTLTGHQASATSVAFSPDGLHIATAALDRTMRLWDVSTGSHLLSFQGHTNRITSVAFSPDGSRIATGAMDCSLRLWNAKNGELLLTMYGHQAGVTSVTFSPDGSQLASASKDGTVRLWDAASGAMLRGHWAGDRLSGQGHAIWAPPGAEPEHPEGRLISASGDAWRMLGWQVWDHPSAPGQWTRLPLGAYPGESGAD